MKVLSEQPLALERLEQIEVDNNMERNMFWNQSEELFFESFLILGVIQNWVSSKIFSRDNLMRFQLFLRYDYVRLGLFVLSSKIVSLPNL